MIRFLYRAISATGIVDVTKLFVASAETVCERAGDALEDVEHRFVDEAELHELAADEAIPIHSSAIERHLKGDRCLAIVVDGQVASYCWFAFGSINRENNRGIHPRSGVSLKFPEATAFVYNGFTREEYRGRGLAKKLMFAGAKSLTKSGIDTMLATSDWANTAAHRSLQKSGFEGIGFVSVANLGSFRRVSLPQAAVAYGVTMSDEQTPLAEQTLVEADNDQAQASRDGTKEENELMTV